jgi:hypothetical protein
MSLKDIAKTIRKDFNNSTQFFSQTNSNQSNSIEAGSIVKKIVLDYKNKMDKMLLAEKDLNKVDWKNCKHLRILGEKHNCAQFFTVCAKEKCPPKYFEAKE